MQILGLLLLLVSGVFKFLFTTTEGGDGAGAGTGTSGTGTGQDNNSGAGGQGAPDPRIKQLSDEAASWRNKHKDANTLAEQRLQQLTEAQNKLTAAESQFGVEKALLMAAARAKFNDPADALKFVDVAAILKLEADKRDGAITDALSKLATERAYLVQAVGTTDDKGKGGGAAGNPSPANPASGVKFTAEQVKKMSREEIAANWEEVSKLLPDIK